MSASVSDLEIIEVALTPLASPNLPLILAGKNFMASLKEVRGQVVTLSPGLKTAAEAQLAANLQTRLTKAKGALKAERLKLSEPFRLMQQAINDAAKAPTEEIEALEATLSKLQTAYMQEQQRLAREAEQARQRELEALRVQQQKEREAEEARQAELRKQADEAAALAAKSGKRVMEAEEEEVPEVAAPTVTEQKIAEVLSAPVVAAVRPAGVRLVTKLVATVIDVNALPDIFVTKTAKQAAINSAYCTGYKEGQALPVCAGIVFTLESSTQSTGRSGF